MSPEFIRIPADGERCQHTGLGRTTMRRLCVPIKANGYRPAVPAKQLRAEGNVQGIWVVPYAALVAHLHGLPTPGMAGGKAESAELRVESKKRPAKSA